MHERGGVPQLDIYRGLDIAMVFKSVEVSSRVYTLHLLLLELTGIRSSPSDMDCRLLSPDNSALDGTQLPAGSALMQSGRISPCSEYRFTVQRPGHQKPPNVTA